MKSIFYRVMMFWNNFICGKLRRLVAVPQSRMFEPLPVAFAAPSSTVIRNMDRQRGLGPWGIRDCILLSDRFAAQRAAATLNAARINRGQWHRATRVPS